MAPSSSTIPPTLLPYLESLQWRAQSLSRQLSKPSIEKKSPGNRDQIASEIHDLILVTQILSYSANWLLLRFVQHALQVGSAHDDQSHPVNRVILCSFIHGPSFWTRALARLRVDVKKASTDGSLLIIDALREERFENTFLEVQKAADDGTAGSETIVILNGVDVVLASTEGDAVPLLAHINSIQRRARAVICALHVDIDLGMKPDRNTLGEMPIERQHRTLVFGLASNARMIMSVRGLDTGVAKDVSGVMTVTRGPEDWDEVRKEVEEGEWLYFIRSDGGVDIFRRGEGVR